MFEKKLQRIEVWGPGVMQSTKSIIYNFSYVGYSNFADYVCQINFLL